MKLGRPIKDMTGLTFGHLTVVKQVDNRLARKSEAISWNCNCSCGAVNVIVRGDHLRLGRSTSCGHIVSKRFAKSIRAKKSYTRIRRAKKLALEAAEQNIASYPVPVKAESGAAILRGRGQLTVKGH
jgi:hypothetical protein